MDLSHRWLQFRMPRRVRGREHQPLLRIRQSLAARMQGAPDPSNKGSPASRRFGLDHSQGAQRISHRHECLRERPQSADYDAHQARRISRRTCPILQSPVLILCRGARAKLVAWHAHFGVESKSVHLITPQRLYHTTRDVKSSGDFVVNPKKIRRLIVGERPYSGQRAICRKQPFTRPK